MVTLGTQTTGEAFAGSIFIIALVFGYFIPGIIAAERRHKNTLATEVLNLFLGWSVLGWIIALVWACIDNVDEREARK